MHWNNLSGSKISYSTFSKWNKASTSRNPRKENCLSRVVVGKRGTSETLNGIVLLLQVRSQKNQDLKLEQENKRYLNNWIYLVQENQNVKIKLGTYKENLLCEDPIPWWIVRKARAQERRNEIRNLSQRSRVIFLHLLPIIARYATRQRIHQFYLNQLRIISKSKKVGNPPIVVCKLPCLSERNPLVHGSQRGALFEER